MRNDVVQWFKYLQDKICNGIEALDSGSRFKEDTWSRPGGGGGTTRIFSDGKIIERGGVNFSEVYGEAPEFLKEQLKIDVNDTETTFFATGISIVIHPVNPFVPIIHMNTRYFEMGNVSWFGGGIDLTPHYIKPEDAIYFHKTLKSMCDKFHNDYYFNFKKWADDYFFIKHRNEMRGIGGIFYDQLKANNDITISDRFDFIKATGETFLPVYSELIRRNKDSAYSETEIQWQRLRRGRYVEFNLIYDRGTKFGLETNGRVESILMSLPPIAQWNYDYQPKNGSPEENTLSLLKKGIDWINK